MKFLIIYGTEEGQTRKISRFIESVLDENGQQATIADVTDTPPPPGAYDVILIGTPIHSHEFHIGVRDYAERYATQLNEKKTVFFTVCMAMASKIKEEHDEVHQITREFLDKTGWKPESVWHFAGALRFTQYDYFKRLVMRMIAKRQGIKTDAYTDQEYTNWEELRTRVQEFITR